MAKCLLFWNGATVRLNHEITQIQNGTEDLEVRGDVEITGHTHVYRVDEKNRNIYLPAMVKDNQEWLEEQLKWLYTFSPTKKKVFMIGTKTSSSNILFEVYSANRGTLDEIHVSDTIEVDTNSKKLKFLQRKE